MRLTIRRSPLSLAAHIRPGYAIPRTFPCLVDTGFSGYLVGFVYPDGRDRLQSSLGGVDFMRNPVALPHASWSILADGRRVQTLSGAVLCAMGGTVKECEIRILHTPGPQDPPLILGMSFLKLFRADLSLHFSTKRFALDVRP